MEHVVKKVKKFRGITVKRKKAIVFVSVGVVLDILVVLTLNSLLS